MAKAFLQHLGSSVDLETSYEAVRAGFVALALEKNRRATPFVDEARALKVAASRASRPRDLVAMEDIRAAVLTAAGLSDKACKNIEERDKDEAILHLVRDFLEPAGSAFVEELVFRFLLTRGDKLGGSMRNVGGLMAQWKLTRSIISCLSLGRIPYWWLHLETGQWVQGVAGEADIERSVKALSWEDGPEYRTLLYNVKVPLVKSNVDLSLLSCRKEDVCRNLLRAPERYLALGELKGGIDPAGADEHWKTARTALDRIKTAFGRAKVKPCSFFIGAAIEARMAREIWGLLRKGTLDNAANLADESQMASLAQWLCSL